MSDEKFTHAPPSFGEFGRLSKAIFDKFYFAGLFQIDVRTRTCSDIQFHMSGNKSLDTGYSIGSIQTKYYSPEIGLTLVKRWKTNNTLFAKVTSEDNLLKGLKMSAKCVFEPYTGKKTGSLSAAYKMDLCHMTCDLESVDNNYALIAAFVTRIKCPIRCPGGGAEGPNRFHNFLGGYQMSLDCKEKRITHSQVSMGYYSANFFLQTSVEDGMLFGTSIYQKLNEHVEMGVLVDYNALETHALFSMGCIYHFSCRTGMRAKLNNQGQVGFSLSQKFRPEIMITFSSFVDVKGTGTTFGIGAEFDF